MRKIYLFLWWFVLIGASIHVIFLLKGGISNVVDGIITITFVTLFVINLFLKRKLNKKEGQ